MIATVLILAAVIAAAVFAVVYGVRNPNPCDTCGAERRNADAGACPGSCSLCPEFEYEQKLAKLRAEKKKKEAT